MWRMQQRGQTALQAECCEKAHSDGVVRASWRRCQHSQGLQHYNMKKDQGSQGSCRPQLLKAEYPEVFSNCNIHSSPLGIQEKCRLQTQEVWGGA